MFSRGCCRRQNESSSTESGDDTFLQKVFGKGIPGIAEVDGPWPEIGRSSIPLEIVFWPRKKERLRRLDALIEAGVLLRGKATTAAVGCSIWIDN